MLRAYRDTFQTKVWDYWRKEDFSGLYRYLFGGARLVPGPAEGTPGSGLRADAQVNQVLYLKAAGVIGGDAGFVYDAATNIATLSGGAKLGNLTATRVAYAGTAGLISDDAGFTHQAAVNSGKLLYLNDLTTGGTYAEGLFVQIRYAAGASRDLLNLQSGLPGTTLAERFVVQGNGTIVAGGPMVPDSASGRDLGSTALEWANLYIGTGRAYFGATQKGYVYDDGSKLIIGRTA